MNTALVSYQFEEEPVRVVVINGEPWFVANDVAKVLGYRMASDLTRNLDDDERGTHILRTPSADQEMTIISESGLYAAIFKSRKEEAQRFRKWVTAEVLPAIRKHGRYELAGHQPPPPELTVALDVPSVSVALNMIREARRLFGPELARRVWLDLGLPQPIVDAVPNIAEHPLYPAIREYLADKTFVTTTQVVEAVGLNPDALPDRKIAIEGIKHTGFTPWSARLNGPPTKGWRRQQAEG